MFPWFDATSQQSDHPQPNRFTDTAGTHNVPKESQPFPRLNTDGSSTGTNSSGGYAIHTNDKNCGSSGVRWNNSSGSVNRGASDNWQSRSMITTSTIHDSIQNSGATHRPVATQYGRTPGVSNDASQKYSSNSNNSSNGFHSSILSDSVQPPSSSSWNVYGSRPQDRNQHLQQRSTRQIERECRDTMKSTLQTAAETNIVGQATSERLELQGEQINRIHDDASAIDQSLDTSEYLLNGMRSWWHAARQLVVGPPVVATPNPPKDSKHFKTDTVPANIPRHDSIQSSALNLFGIFGTGGASEGQPISPQPKAAVQQVQQKLPVSSEFDQELNQDLDTLSTMLEEMHSRAVNMGETIDHQNVQLQSVETLVNRNNERVTTQKRQMDKLMGK
eukprot:Lankesteria_metandrocarpae@DN9145_c0_g1_i1.p1